jgi:hypothetical protein
MSQSLKLENLSFHQYFAKQFECYQNVQHHQNQKQNDCESLQNIKKAKLDSIILINCLLVTLRLLFNFLCNKTTIISVLETASSLAETNDLKQGNSSQFVKNNNKHHLKDIEKNEDYAVEDLDIATCADSNSGETPRKKVKRSNNHNTNIIETNSQNNQCDLVYMG